MLSLKLLDLRILDFQDVHSQLPVFLEPRKSKLIVERQIDLKCEFLINFQTFLDVLSIKSWRENLNMHLKVVKSPFF